MVTSALHGAIDFVLSKDAVLYRMATAQDYRLFQAADYLCALELTDIKFHDKSLTETDIKVFLERITRHLSKTTLSGSDARLFNRNSLATSR